MTEQHNAGAANGTGNSAIPQGHHTTGQESPSQFHRPQDMEAANRVKDGDKLIKKLCKDDVATAVKGIQDCSADGGDMYAKLTEGSIRRLVEKLGVFFSEHDIFVDGGCGYGLIATQVHPQCSLSPKH